jgi:hypothetical protein
MPARFRSRTITLPILRSNERFGIHQGSLLLARMITPTIGSGGL